MVVSALRKGFQVTDENVIGECRKVNDWSGTCVCATVIKDKLLYLANLGDSTAVIFQFMPMTKTIFQSVVLSKPHKPKAEEERIDAAGGWVSADGYILGVLGCSRALGDRELKHYDDFLKSGLKKEFEITKERLAASSRKPCRVEYRRARKQSIPKPTMKFLVSPNPEIEVFTLEESDALLVIGSDGLWDYLSPKRCVQLVNDAWSKRSNLDDVCEVLVGAAQQAKSPDDITAMVISLQDRR
jgi:serine/threonine protein phosphatase PrpC